MKKLFLKLSMLLFLLGMSVNAAWAAFDIGSILSGMQNMTADDYYYVQMVATPSPASSGTVQLMWIDMMGDTINANDFSEGEEKEMYAGMYAQLNPGASGNSNPTGYMDRPRLAGTTVLYGDMEAPLGSPQTHVYITSFAYFKAEAKPANGWYFDGWTYADNGNITMLTELRQQDEIYWPTETNPNTNGAVVFKVKPHNQKGGKYLDPEQVETAQYDSVFRYAQANFKPVLLTGYKGGKSEIEVGNANVTFDVYVTLEAKKTNLTTNDFEIPTFDNSAFAITGMEGGYDAETKTPYAKVSVKFTAPNNMTADTFYKTKMRAASKGGSVINVPLEVRAVAANRTQATLFDANGNVVADGDLLGKTVDEEYVKGVLEQITGSDKTLRLNQNNNNPLTLANKTLTLDMNGYTIPSLTVNGGIVTVKFNKYDEGVTEPGSLEVKSGKVVLDGGIFSALTVAEGATVEQNAATIIGGVTNNGTFTTTEGTIKGGLESKKGTLTIKGGTFRGDNAITISGGTAYINKGTIVGTTYGVNATGGTTTIEKYAAINGGTNSVNANGGSVTINNGMFGNALAGSPSLVNGYFKDENVGVPLPEGKNLMNVAAGPEYEEGFRYFVGNAADALASNVGVCRIGSTSYAKLEDAIAYAVNNPKEKDLVILMTNDYTLPAGYYTLPANATIVVPMSDDQTNSNAVVRRTVKNWVKPSEFRRLTFASGVKMEVFGNIEVSCTQHANDVSNHGYNSNPWGPYGHLVMEDGSKLTLQKGSHIYAWGFITGKGEIDARRGATVHEMFQMGDWKGGSLSASLLTDERGVFPVTQYWIQNVEVPAKFHPGAVLTTAAAVSVGNGMVVAYANDINIVGVNGEAAAMFLLDNEADAENTWVHKKYDNEHDLQVYEVNNTAHIGSIVLKLGKLGSMTLDMNSALFKLPITNNMKIHLLSGFMDFTQDTYLLPGAEVEVDKESTVSISKNEDPNVHSGSLYLYDADDWGDWVYDGSGSPNKFTKAVPYEPVIKGRPAIRPEMKADGQKDATIFVHGQFDTKEGYVFTSEHGANIYSTNVDAGTFSFSMEAKGADYTEEVYHAKGTAIDGTADIFYPAVLRNGDGTPKSTAGTPAQQAYCYINDEWVSLFTSNGFVADINWDKANEVIGKIVMNQDADINEAINAVYIKPKNYVQIIANVAIGFKGNDYFHPYLDVAKTVGNADHTFSDAAGDGRLFIRIEAEEGQEFAQWWEVEKDKNSNLYHCIHPQNNTYYYWVEGDEDEPGYWEEKRYNVTFKNWDGTILKTIGSLEDSVEVCSVTYGTELEYLGNTPTRAQNVDSTYTFTGKWKPALGPVTQDVTYTAVFESKPRMYTIVFKKEGNKVIETHFLKHNEVPVCENTPTEPGKHLVWVPAISEVIGDQTYTATFEEELPTEWDVTFVNNAQGELQATMAVSVNDHPAYTGATPKKENADHKPYLSSEYIYTFWGWSAVIDGVAQQFEAGAELPSPTAHTIYTAVYSEKKKPYTVTFLNEDNSVIESNEYSYGETPVCSATPTKENTAEFTYKFAWNPQIQTVMGNATYKAVFTPTTNQYTVTLKSNLTGVCTFTGAGSFDYGKEDNRISVIYDSQKYKFEGWSGRTTKDTTFVLGKLEGDSAFTANFSVKNLNDLVITESKTLTEKTEVKDFILTSNGINASGQIFGANYLDIKGDAIFKLAPAAVIPARTWYAVAAPWQVDIRTGVYANGKRLAVGSGFDMIEFDAEAYARDDNGEGNRNIWKYVDENGGIMMPGKLYMIYLASAQPSLEFHMKRGTSIITVKTAVDVTGGTGDKANWNAIANPALFHADLGISVIKDPEKDVLQYIGGSYTPTTAKGLIVGQPIFVQVNDKQPIVSATVATGGGAGMPAYRRAPKTTSEADSRFVIEIARNGQMNDRLIVQTVEDKDNTYVIGQDLAKMGIGSKAAQLWMERYNTNLCKNTAQIENGRAEFPLSVFAPTAGEYTISAVAQRGDLTLYLTRDGEAIANLSDGDYTLMLERGTAYQYGLRVSARSPQVATGCDEVVAEGAGNAQKVLVNGQIFIIRGEKAYTVDGQLVK